MYNFFTTIPFVSKTEYIHTHTVFLNGDRVEALGVYKYRTRDIGKGVLQGCGAQMHEVVVRSWHNLFSFCPFSLGVRYL